MGVQCHTNEHNITGKKEDGRGCHKHQIRSPDWANTFQIAVI